MRDAAYYLFQVACFGSTCFWLGHDPNPITATCAALMAGIIVMSFMDDAR